MSADPRLREITYDPRGVVHVPVRRGNVTLVLLDADESLVELAAGLGGDCSKPDAAWCIAAQPGGRTVFVKPRRTAVAANNLVVVTSRRIHNLRLQVLADNDPRPELHRLAIMAPPGGRATGPNPGPDARTGTGADGAQPPSSDPELRALLALSALEVHLESQLQAQLQARTSSPAATAQLLSERLQAKPEMVNSRYALAEGEHSQDIVPTLVFDDGRFTYLRLPGNREMPAVFQVLSDGSETLVNARMEDDLLVVDRVTRRLVLRAGASVVALWNEAFDVEGRAPDHGTTVPGIRRTLKAVPSSRSGSRSTWPHPKQTVPRSNQALRHPSPLAGGSP